MKHLLFILLLFVCPGAWCQEHTDSGRKLTIHKIIIEGNRVTRRPVIVREMSIHEGQTIASDSLNDLVEQNKLRLFNLQLFNEVDQHVVYNGNEIDWYVQVKERWYIIPAAFIQFADRNINTWWVTEHHDLRRLTGGVMVTDRNFLGNLESLTVTLQGGYTQKIGISYMKPYINKSQTSGIGFSFNVFENRQTYYNTDSNKLVYTGTYTGPVVVRKVETGVSYIYRPAYPVRNIFQVTYKDYTVGDTVVKLNPDYFADRSRRARYLEFFYRLEYNGVDNWNYSLEGRKLVSFTILNKGLQGINVQAFSNLEAGVFHSFLPKWYYSAIFRGRLMYPQEQPYYFRDGLGTETDYVRGYEYYVIDGSNYGLLRLDLKRELFNHTYTFPLRYFTALPIRIYPKVFADGGYVTSPQPGNSFLSNRFLYSAGFGIDLVLLYDIKIRFEYAWNLLNQKGLYLHFDSE